MSSIATWGYGNKSRIATWGYGSISRIIEEAVRRAAQYIPTKIKMTVRLMAVEYSLKANIMRKERFDIDLKSSTIGKELVIFYKILANTITHSETTVRLLANLAVPFRVTKVIVSDIMVPKIVNFGVRANTVIHNTLSLPVRGIKDIRRRLLEILEEEGNT